jgi:hypothetical protein
MASEANKLIADKTDIEIKLADNHIQCFCHKIALILTGGLQAIGLEVTPPAQEKQSLVGYFPQLVQIIKDFKEKMQTTRPTLLKLS